MNFDIFEEEVSGSNAHAGRVVAHQSLPRLVLRSVAAET